MSATTTATSAEGLTRHDYARLRMLIRHETRRVRGIPLHAVRADPDAELEKLTALLDKLRDMELADRIGGRHG